MKEPQQLELQRLLQDRCCSNLELLLVQQMSFQLYMHRDNGLLLVTFFSIKIISKRIFHINFDFILCKNTLNSENAHENNRIFTGKMIENEKNNHSCSWILFRKNWIHCFLTPRTLSLLLLASVMNIFALNLLLQYSFSCLYIYQSFIKKTFFSNQF